MGTDAFTEANEVNEGGERGFSPDWAIVQIVGGRGKGGVLFGL